MTVDIPHIQDAQRGGRGPVKAIMTAFRISARDLAEIDRRANERGMNRTEYITLAALDRLDAFENDSIALQLESFERRLQRLEDFSFGTD